MFIYILRRHEKHVLSLSGQMMVKDWTGLAWHLKLEAILKWHKEEWRGRKKKCLPFYRARLHSTPNPSLEDNVIVKTSSIAKHLLPSNIDMEIPQLTRAWVRPQALLIIYLSRPIPGSQLPACLPSERTFPYTNIKGKYFLN